MLLGGEESVLIRVVAGELIRIVDDADTHLGSSHTRQSGLNPQILDQSVLVRT